MNIGKLYTEAVQNTRSGQYAEAIEKLELILTHKIDGDDKADVCTFLGVVYLTVGKNEHGVRRLKEATTIAPNNAPCWSNLSEGLRRLDQLDEAIDAAHKALLLDPDDVQAHNNMGNALKEQTKFDAAIESYRKALTLKPDYVEAHNNMGVALRGQGKLDDAIAAFQKVLKLKPDYVGAQNNLGNALKDQGKLDDAIAAFQKVLKLKPDYAGAYYNLGNALKDQGKIDDALEAYLKALSLKPDYADAYNNMGNALEQKGKLNEAETSYRKAIEINPNAANSYLSLSNVLSQFQKFKESHDNHVKALKLYSSETISNSNLETVIPKFVKKLQKQNGIPSFFDSKVNMHLIQAPDSPVDYCQIFDDGQSAIENRFVFYSDRMKTIPESMPSGRLFEGLPFCSSQGIHSIIKWKEHLLHKTTFDLVLYWMIIQEVKPDTIIELGSGLGGSAVWLADIALALGLNTHVYSYDINKPNITHERVTFIEYDLTIINKETKIPCWENFSGRKIVIEDAHVNLSNILYSFDTILNKDDYLIIEDSDTKQEGIAGFADEKKPKYKLDKYFLDFFGTNITCSQNSIFKVFK